MNAEELTTRLSLLPKGGGEYRVNARESTDLEFKRDMAVATFKKSLKTIAAFANKNGGIIVFGVSDNPRMLVGLNGQVLDEGQQSEQIVAAISPIPTTHFYTVELHGRDIGVLLVEPLSKPPAIAIKDLSGAQGNDNILRKGTVYTRRRGQTAPIAGEEFSQLLLSRDERIRSEIFTYLGRGREIGFDQVVVADPRSDAEEGDQEMTYYLPATAAANMNVIDRGTLVQDGGAPAYKLVGNVQLSTPADKDPRNPKRPSDAVEEMRPTIEEVFDDAFPWSHSHLRKAAEHLGFWNQPEGDKTHTGVEPITGTTLYYAKARDAVAHFARQTPDDFVEVVGSQKTQQAWKQRRLEASDTEGDA